MSKISLVGKKEVNEKILNGFGYMARAVRYTLGPFGLNTMFEKGNKIENDGANTARAVAPTIKDPFERRAALVGLKSATDTEEEVQDGTSTNLTLADEILKKASKLFISPVGSIKTPSSVIAQVNKELEEVKTKLDGMT